MRSLLVVCSLVPMLLVSTVVVGQSLVTDRPDFTESATSVPKGTVQIEGGFTVAKLGDTRTTSGPELLLRWAFAKNVELRLQSPDFVFADGTSGVGDPTVGFKIAFAPVSEWSVAAIAVTSIPVGETGDQKGDFEPLLIVTVGRSVGQISLGSQIQGAWNGSTEQILIGGTLVLATSLSDQVGAFAETTVSQVPIGTAAVTLHSGLTFAVAHLVQLDLHFGAGLTDTAPDVLFGAGLSLRR